MPGVPGGYISIAGNVRSISFSSDTKEARPATVADSHFRWGRDGMCSVSEEGVTALEEFIDHPGDLLVVVKGQIEAAD